MKKAYRLLLSCVFTLFLISCGKDKDADCQVCTGQAPADFTHALVLNSDEGQSLIIDASFWYTNTPGQIDYTYASYRKAQAADKYNEINKFMSNMIGGENGQSFLSNDNYSFTLYLDGKIEKEQTFSESSILAYNIYSVKDNSLYHKFFVKTPDGFVENKRLSVIVKGADIAELYYLALRYLHPPSNSVIALQLGFTDQSKAKHFKFNRFVPETLKLRMAYDQMMNSNTLNRTTDETALFAEFYRVALKDDGGDVICPSPCPPVANHKYCEGSSGPAAGCQKSSSICRLSIGADLMSSNSDNQLHDSLPSAYDLRDNFLQNSNRGNFYNDTYSYIGYSMSDLTLSETAILASIFISDGAPTLRNFMHGNQSNVLYSDSVANQAIAAINIIKAKLPSTDTMGLKIMDWYTLQINDYKNLSISAIKSTF